MKFGTTISLDEKDLEKLNYIQDKTGHPTGKGLTSLIRLVIQKAYAHQVMLDTKDILPDEKKKIIKSVNADVQKKW